MSSECRSAAPGMPISGAYAATPRATSWYRAATSSHVHRRAAADSLIPRNLDKRSRAAAEWRSPIAPCLPRSFSSVSTPARRTRDEANPPFQMSHPVAPMSRADMPAPADAGEAKNSSQSDA
eukprot:3220133-Heterocapsa_arctica.AAC.1